MSDLVTIHPLSRLVHIRTGEQCSPYMPVASTARRYGGFRARVNGNKPWPSITKADNRCPIAQSLAPGTLELAESYDPLRSMASLDVKLECVSKMRDVQFRVDWAAFP